MNEFASFARKSPISAENSKQLKNEMPMSRRRIHSAQTRSMNAIATNSVKLALNCRASVFFTTREGSLAEAPAYLRPEFLKDNALARNGS